MIECRLSVLKGLKNEVEASLSRPFMVVDIWVLYTIWARLCNLYCSINWNTKKIHFLGPL